MGIQYSAAKTSIITPRLLKTNKQKTKNILSPHGRATAKAIQTRKKKEEGDRLVVQDYNVQLDYQLPKGGDVSNAIDVILENPWEESSSLHSQYFTKEEIRDHAPHELVHMLRGLSQTAKNDILRYRQQNVPQVLVTVSQLYSIYQQRGNTYVDKSVEMSTRSGKIRRFVITNAAPVVSKSLQKYQNGKVTYGFENVEVLTKAKVYHDLIDGAIAENTGLQQKALQDFSRFVHDNPTALYVDGALFSKDQLSCLLSLGFVTLTSNYLNEIEAHQYAVSYPNCGIFLKLLNNGRAWVVKTLSKCANSEALEEQLRAKWEGRTTAGEPKMNNFRKPFYGYDLSWILADALGGGIVEVFNTPVGRGWKLTGKA